MIVKFFTTIYAAIKTAIVIFNFVVAVSDLDIIIAT